MIVAALLLGIGAISLTVGIIRDRLHWRRVRKTVIASIKAENPQFDEQLLIRQLKRDQAWRRRHDDEEPPTAMAA